MPDEPTTPADLHSLKSTWEKRFRPLAEVEQEFAVKLRSAAQRRAEICVAACRLIPDEWLELDRQPGNEHKAVALRVLDELRRLHEKGTLAALIERGEIVQLSIRVELSGMYL